MPHTYLSSLSALIRTDTCDNDASAQFVAAQVDVMYELDRSLTIAWLQAPGTTRRPVDSDVAAQISGMAREVGARERDPYSHELIDIRLELGALLFGLLDGPERAMTRRLNRMESCGHRLALVLRLRSREAKELARHPALRWRWELLANHRGHLLVDSHDGSLAFAVQLGDRTWQASRPPEHNGLRILFMAYSPRDLGPTLDYEYEEERLLESTAPFVRDGRMQLHVVELGSLDDLGRCLLAREYDIVHLSGHGELTGNGPRLIMEDEFGDGVPVVPEELLEVFRRGSRMPGAVMISSCHSASIGGEIPGFAAHLVAGGIPAVVGWAQQIRDELAIDTAADIYQRLCAGAPLALAVAFARAKLYETARDAARLPYAWSTLQLIARDGGGFRTDSNGRSLSDEPGEPDESYHYLEQQGKMRVLKKGFVGRRRQLQRLIRVLLLGEEQLSEDDTPVRRAGVIIVGMKGVGKSCLASRAIERLSREQSDPSQLGVVVLKGLLDSTLVREQLEALALRWDDLWARHILYDPTGGSTLGPRIRRLLASHWRRRKLVLVLDDFEPNLDIQPDGPARLSPYAAELLEVLLPACQVGRPKVVITTTASFEIPGIRHKALAVLRLGPVDPSAMSKLWNRGVESQEGHDGDHGISRSHR